MSELTDDQLERFAIEVMDITLDTLELVKGAMANKEIL